MKRKTKKWIIGSSAGIVVAGTAIPIALPLLLKKNKTASPLDIVKTVKNYLSKKINVLANKENGFPDKDSSSNITTLDDINSYLSEDDKLENALFEKVHLSFSISDKQSTETDSGLLISTKIRVLVISDQDTKIRQETILTLGGFVSQADVEAASISHEDVVQAIKSYSPASPTELASKYVFPTNIKVAKNGTDYTVAITPPTTEDINDWEGKIDFLFEVKFDKGEMTKKPPTKKATLDGFQTSANPTELVGKINELFSQNEMIALQNKSNDFSSSFTENDFKAEINSLISNITIEMKSGTLEVKLENRVEGDGNISYVVTVVIKYGERLYKSTSKKIVMTGFKTNEDKSAEIVDNAKKAFDTYFGVVDDNATFSVNNKPLFPESISSTFESFMVYIDAFKKSFDKGELGDALTTAKFEKNEDEGSIEWTITFTHGKIKKTSFIRIDGYKTKVEIALEEVTKDLIELSLKNNSSYWWNLESLATDYVKNHPTITNLRVTTTNGVAFNVSLELSAANDKEGKIDNVKIVSIVIEGTSKNLIDSLQNKDIFIDGFKSVLTDDQIIGKINDQLANIPENKEYPIKASKEINPATATLDELKILLSNIDILKTYGSTLEINFAKDTDIDEINGKVSVTIQFSVGSIKSDTKTIVLTGFQTLQEYISIKRDIFSQFFDDEASALPEIINGATVDDASKKAWELIKTSGMNDLNSAKSFAEVIQKLTSNQENVNNGFTVYQNAILLANNKFMINEIDLNSEVLSAIVDSSKSPADIDKPADGIFTYNGETVSYTFTQWDPNLVDGSITWSATITMGSGPTITSRDISSQILSGFKNQNDANQDIVNEIAANILFNEDVVINDSNGVAAIDAGNLNSSNNLGITLPTELNGAVVTYTHLGISNDGILNIQILISKDNQNATKKISINVTGIDQAIKDKAINDANAAITSEVNNPKGSITKSGDVFWNEKPVKDDFTYNPPTGLNYEFVSATKVDSNGFSDVIISISDSKKLGTPQQTTIKVGEFETQAEYDSRTINAMIQTIIDDPDSYQATVSSATKNKTASDVDMSEITLPKLDASFKDIKLEVVSVMPEGSDGKSIKVRIRVYSSVAGTHEKFYYTVISGFKSTLDQKIEQEQKLVDEYVLNQNHKEPIFNGDAATTLVENLSVNNFTISPEGVLNLIVTNVVPADANDDNGQAKVTIEVSTNTNGVKSKTYDVIVTGFLTRKSHDLSTYVNEKVINDAIKKSSTYGFDQSDIASAWMSNLTGNKIDGFDIKLGETDFTLNITFSNADDIAGTIEYQLEVFVGSDKMLSPTSNNQFTLDGFKTQETDVQKQQAVQKKLDDIAKQTINVDADNAKISPASVDVAHAITLFNELIGNKIGNTFEEDPSITIKSHDELTGTLVIHVKYSYKKQDPNNPKVAKAHLTINGFLSLDQAKTNNINVIEEFWNQEALKLNTIEQGADNNIDQSIKTAWENSKTVATTAINNATDIASIDQIVKDQQQLIKDALAAYNQNITTANEKQRLENLKAKSLASIEEINKITITRNDNWYSGTKYDEFIKKRDEFIAEINAATTEAAIDPILAKAKVDLRALKDAYLNSNGTNQDLVANTTVNDISNWTTANKQTLPSEAGDRSSETGITDDNVSYIVTNWSVDDATGEITYTIKFYLGTDKQSHEYAEKIFSDQKISDFQTQSERDKADEIKAANQAIIAEANNPTGTFTIVNKRLYKEQVDETDITIKAPNAFTYEFISASAVNDSGISIIKFWVSKNSPAGLIKKEGEFELRGFESKQESEVRELQNAKTDAIVEINKITKPQQDNATHSESIWDELIKMYEDAEREINAASTKALVQAAKQLWNTKINNKITEYESSKGTDQDDLDAILEDDIKDFITSLSKIDLQKLPSGNLRPVNVTEKLTNNIQVEFTVWNPNDDNGSISWTVRISKGAAERVMSGTVDGFLTNNQKTINDANDLIDKAVKDKKPPTYLNQVKDKTASELTINDFTKPIVASGLEARITAVSPRNGGDGSVVVVEIEISSPTVAKATPQKYNVEITGFKTLSEKNIDKENARISQEVAKKILPTFDGTIKTKTAIFITASDFDVPILASDLVATITDVSPRAGGDGSVVIVEIEISSTKETKATPQKYTVEITGFLSQAEHDMKTYGTQKTISDHIRQSSNYGFDSNDEVDDWFARFTNKQISGYDIKLGDTDFIFTITLSDPDHFGGSIKYTITATTKDGTVVTSPATPTNKFNLSGFRTNETATQKRDKVQSSLDAFALTPHNVADELIGNNEVKNSSPNIKLSEAQDLFNKIGSQVGNTYSTSPVVTLVSNGHNEKDGTLKIIVTYTLTDKDGNSEQASATITLSGFLTIANAIKFYVSEIEGHYNQRDGEKESPNPGAVIPPQATSDWAETLVNVKKFIEDSSKISTITIAQIITRFESQKTVVDNALTVYNDHVDNANNTKLLNDAKQDATSEINGLNYPPSNPAEHDQSEFVKIENAKTKAISDISNATSIADVSTKLGLSKSSINGLIDTYLKSKGTDQSDVEAVTVAQINTLIEGLAQFTSISSMLPSESTKPTNTLSLSNGITVEFTHWTNTNDIGGKISWTVELTKGSNGVKTLSGENDNFQNKSERDLQVANTAIVDESNNPSGVILKKSQVHFGDTPSASNLSIDKPNNSDLKYTFINATAIDANGKSDITVEISSISVSNATKKQIIVEVTGFETESQANLRKLNAKKVAAISDIDNNIQLPIRDFRKHSEAEWNKINTAITDAKSAINKATTESEVDQLLTTWKATINKAITDYNSSKGTDKANIDAFTESSLSLPNSDKSALPSSLPDRSNLNNNGTTSSGVKWEIVSWIVSDDAGTIKWNATITIGSESKTINGTISGFQTKADVQKIKDTTSIANVTTGDLDINSLIDKNKLPSENNKPATFTLASGVQVTFTKWDQKDVDGQIDWEVNLTKGQGTSKKITGTLQNLQTTAEKKTIDTQAKIDDIVTNTSSPKRPALTTASKDKTASALKISDFSLAQSSDADLVFQINKVERKSSSDGSIAVITIEVSSVVSNTNNKTYEVEVSGFKTQALSDLGQYANQNAINDLVKANATYTFDSTINIDDWMNKLPNNKKIVNFDVKLGITNFKFTLTFSNVDNYSGSADYIIQAFVGVTEITPSPTSGGAYTLSGFHTNETDVQKRDKVQAALDKIKTNPHSIPSVDDQSPAEIDVAHALSIFNSLNLIRDSYSKQPNVVIASGGVNETNGTLKITVSYTFDDQDKSNPQIATADIAFSGFMTIDMITTKSISDLEALWTTLNNSAEQLIPGATIPQSVTDEWTKSLQDAKTEINQLKAKTGTTINDLKVLATNSETKLRNAQNKYNNAIKSANAQKELSDQKSKSKTKINNLPYPSKDNGLHDETKWQPILNAKAASISAIDGATDKTSAISEESQGTIEINKAINDYNNSKGTDQSDVDAITVDQINSAIKTLITNFSKQLPSETNKPSGDVAITNGVLAKFTVWTNTNDSEGKISWTATLTKRTNASATLSGVVDKFQTTDQRSVQNANTAINNEKSTHTGSIVKKDLVHFDVAPTINDITINQPPNQDLEYTFVNATKVNSNGESTITIRISSKSIASATAQETTFTVTGFENKTQADARLLTTAKKDAEIRINAIKIPAKEFNKHDEAIWDSIESAKRTALSEINAATLATINNILDQHIDTINDLISDFASSTGTDQKAVDNVNESQISALISTLITNMAAQLPSTVDNPSTTQKDIKIGAQDVVVVFTIWTANDDKGEISWTITLKKDSSATRTMTGVKDGFLSSSQNAINIANALIDSTVQSKPAITVKSSIDKKSTLVKDLIIADFVTPTTKDIIYTITDIRQKNNDESTVIITVKVESNVLGSKKGSTYEFSITGFKTSADVRREAAQKKIDDAVAKKTPPTIKTSSLSKLSSEVSASDFIVPSAPDLVFTISSFTPGSVEGTVDLVITVASNASDGSTSKTYNVTVSGFTTLDQRNKQITDNVKSKISAPNTVTINDLNGLPAINNQTLASNNNLNITIPADIQGTVIKYSHREIKNDGNLKITITITKGTQTSTLDVTISIVGIDKAINDKEVADANAAITKEVGTPTGTVSSNSSNTVVWDDNPAASDLVISSPTGFIYSFGSATKVNDNGESSITINVIDSSRKGSAQSFTVTVNGFETKDVYDKRIETARLNTVLNKKPAPSVAVATKDKTADDINISDIIKPTITEKDITLTVIKVKSANVDGTEINVTIQIKSDKLTVPTLEYTVKLTGFKSKTDSDREKLQAKIDDIITNVQRRPKPTFVGTKNSTLIKDVNNGDFTIQATLDGMNFSIQSVVEKTNSNDSGIATVTILVSGNMTGIVSKTYTIDVGGFKTQALHDLETHINNSTIADNIKNNALYSFDDKVNVDDWMNDKLTNKKISNWSIQLGETTFEITITFMNADNFAGTVQYWMTVKANGKTLTSPATLNNPFTLNGFHTNDTDDQKQSKVQAALDALNQPFNASTNFGDKSPASISSAELKTIFDSLIANNVGDVYGVTPTLSIVAGSVNEQDGSLKVKASYSFNDQNPSSPKIAEKEITITGFLTIANAKTNAKATLSSYWDTKDGQKNSLIPSAILAAKDTNAWNKAKSDAATAIDNVTSISQISQIITDQKALIDSALTAINDAINKANDVQRLKEAKDQATIAIDNITIPLDEPKWHDTKKHAAIISKKVEINNAIKNATTISAVNSALSTGTTDLNSLISDYDSSNGTNYDLVQAATENDISSWPATNNKLLASEVDNFMNRTGQTTNNVDWKVETWTVDDVNGTITWAIKFQIGDNLRNESKSINGTITGFQTQAQRNIEDALKKANQDIIKEAANPTGTFTIVNNNRHHGEQVVQSDINIIASSDFTYTFISATTVNDNGTSLIKFWVSKSSPTGVARKEAEYTLSGFETKQEATDRLIREAKTAAIATVKAITKPSHDAKVHSETIWNELTKMYVDAENAINAGTSVQNVKSIRDNWVRDINDKVDSYNKSTGTDQSDVEAVIESQLNNLIAGLGVLDLSRLPSNNAKPINITAKVGSGVSVTISSWDQDDAAGTITWEATLTKGSGTTTLTGSISNFLTTAQKIIDDENALINAEVAKQALPTYDSALKQKDVTEISASDFTPPIVSGNLTSSIIEVKPKPSSDGSIAVITIEISSSITGTTSKSYEVEVTGFKTITERNLEKENARITAEVAKNHIPTYDSSLLDKTAKKVTASDFTAPALPSGLTAIVKSVTPKPGGDGSIVVATIEITSFNIPAATAQTYTVEINGFLTQAQSDMNEFATETFINSLIENDGTHGFSSADNVDDWLKKLTNKQITNWTVKIGDTNFDLTLTFTNDKFFEGSVEYTITALANGKAVESPTKNNSYTLQGFHTNETASDKKTKVQNNLDNMAKNPVDVANVDIGAFTAKNKSPDITQAQALLFFKQIESTLGNTYNTSPDVTLAIGGVDESKGIVEINVSYTLTDKSGGSEVATAKITLSGFLTVSQSIANAITTITDFYNTNDAAKTKADSGVNIPSAVTKALTDALVNAKAAIHALSSKQTTSIIEVENTLRLQKNAITSEFDKYNNAVQQANDAKKIADEKVTSVAAINALTYPSLDAAQHDAALFALIATAKANAINAINSATTIQDVRSELQDGEINIKGKIASYLASKGTDQNDVNAVTVDQINTLIEGLTQFSNISKMLPSESSLPTGSHALANGIAAEFTLWTNTNDQRGEVAWTVTLTKGKNGTTSLSGVIDKFQDTTERDLQDANAAIISEQNTHTGSVVMKTSVHFGVVPLVGNLTINQPTNTDLKYEFESASSVDANGESTITIRISSKSIASATAKTTTFTVTGFETEAESIARLLAARKVVVVGDINNISVPAKNTREHSEADWNAIGKAKTDANAAINGGSTIAEVNTLFNTWKTNIDNAINKYNSSTGSDKIKIDAFVESSLTLPIGDKNALPSSLVDRSKTANKNNSGATADGVTWTIKIWTVDDDAGTISWSANIVIGNQTKTIAGKITGFKTNADVQKINDTKSIAGVSEANLNLNTLIDKSKLPTENDKPQPFTLANGVLVTFTTWTQNDANGEIEWEVNLTKNQGTAKKLSGTVSGILTSGQRKTKETQAKIDDISTNASSSGRPTLSVDNKNKTSSQLANNNFSLSNTGDKDLTFTIISVSRKPNSDGSIAVVEIRVSSSITNTTDKTYEVEMAGFKTQALADLTQHATQTEINNLIKTSTAYAFDATIDVTNWMSSKLTNDKFADFDVTLGSTDFKFTITFTNANKFDGSVQYTIKAVANGKDVTPSPTDNSPYTLQGFKTNDTDEQKRDKVQTRLDTFAANNHDVADHIINSKAMKTISPKNITKTQAANIYDSIKSQVGDVFGENPIVTLVSGKANETLGTLVINIAYTYDDQDPNSPKTASVEITLTGFLTISKSISDSVSSVDSYWNNKDKSKTQLASGVTVPSTVTDAWAKALTDAKSALNGLTTGPISQIISELNDQKSNIDQALTTYNAAVAAANAAKALQDEKDDAINEINRITLPTLDAAQHDANKFPAIDQAKVAAINAINAATTTSAVLVEKTSGTQAINSAIADYDNSKGTDQSDVNAVTVAMINTEIEILIADFATKLPSETTKPAGTISIANGISLVFKTWNTTNDAEGKIAWTAELTKGSNATKTISGENDNFQTAVARALQVANLAITDEVSKHTGSIVKKVVVHNGVMPKATDITITQPTNADLKYTFNSATKVDADGKSVITVEVSSKSVANATKKTTTFTVSGFETKADENVRLLAETIAKFKPLIDATDGTESVLVDHANIFASTLTNKTTASDLGFNLPANISNQVSISYVATANDADGKLIITATIAVGTVTDNITFTIKGYLTTVKNNINKANERIDKEIVRLAVANPETIIKKKTTANPSNGTTPKITDFDLIPQTGEFAYSIKTIEPINKNGEVKVTLNISIPSVSGSKTGTKEVIINGFERESVGPAIKDILEDLDDNKMKGIDDPTKIISGYAHEVFVEGFTKEYILNKIKDRFWVQGIPSDEFTVKNINIKLTDQGNNGHIIVEIIDNDGSAIKELNFHLYKYSEEFVLDTSFEASVRSLVDFSESIDESVLDTIREYINNHQFMSGYNDDAYKNSIEYIKTSTVSSSPSPDTITIVIETKNSRIFTYVLKDFNSVPGIPGIKTKINTGSDLHLNALKNPSNGNILASDISIAKVLEALKNELKSLNRQLNTEEENTLEGMKNNFKLVANDESGELNIEFYLQSDVIKWSLKGYLKILADKELTSSNVGNFILHPKAYPYVSTINSNAFEGKTIPDGFVFPKSIQKLEAKAFYQATFAGTFTLPEGIDILGNSTFEKAIFNADFKLPDSIEDMGRLTFNGSIWKNGAVLTKLPNSLKVLYGSSLLKNVDSSPIPLPPDFTLENTKIERIEGEGSYDQGLFYQYQLPATFKLPNTIKYIGRWAFHETDFSLLPNKKLVIPHYDVEVRVWSGLDKNNTVYDQSAPITKITWSSVDRFLISPNDSAFSNVTTIGASAFEGKTIPDGFVFPKNIQKLEGAAFHNATFAGTFTLPEGITEFTIYTFSGATFNKDVTLPDSIEDMGKLTFTGSTWNNGAVLTKLPNNLKVLHGSSLESANDSPPIPLTSDFTLENTKLERIEDEETYDQGLFYQYQLPVTFKLPNTIKYIGKWTFHETEFSLLPNGKLILPNYDIEINSDSGLDASNSIYDNSAKINILTSTWVDKFLSNPNDQAFSNLTTIDSNAFKGKTIPDGFVFPSSIINIEDNAFDSAIFAGTFTLPSGIIRLGNNAFKEATFKADVTLPNSIEDMGEFTFTDSKWENGAVLTKLPNNLKVLHGSSFSSMNNSTLIPLSNNFTLENTNLERIEDSGINDQGAFYGYTLPADFKLPDTIKYIGINAFKDVDFSQLPNSRLEVPFDVYNNPLSGLDEKNTIVK